MAPHHPQDCPALDLDAADLWPCADCDESVAERPPKYRDVDPHRKCGDYAREDPDYLCSVQCPGMDEGRRARIRAAFRVLYPYSDDL
jgi:hypothetical protein